MSGLEVIGIILGGIPLVISALEHYKDGAHAIHLWRKYKTEIASVIRQLRVQQSRLMNVCETLLEGLGLGGKIEAMINEPFGSLWQDEGNKKKLTQRLHRDYEIFEEIAMEMSVAIGDIKKRIGLGPDGKIGWIKSSPWKRELKRASFTFDRREYKDLLCILKEGNDFLETLTRYNRDLEPKRRGRLESRQLSLHRIISDNVFRALQNSLSCSCNHGFGLGLSQENIRRESHMATQDFVFRVGISESNSVGNFRKEILLASSTTAQHGQNASISTLQPNTTNVRMIHSHPSAITNLNTAQTTTYTQMDPLTLLSSLPSGVTEITAANTANVPTSQQNVPNQIGDLCSTVLGRIAEPSSLYYGDISTYQTEAFSNFEVYASTATNGHGCDLITLEQILRADDGLLGEIAYTQKIRLVYMVSYAVLQLSEKSWLADRLSSKDIIFVRENGSIDYERVFIGRDIFDQNPPPIPSKKAIGKRSRNCTLLALAILLIEIMLQSPFEKLRENPRSYNKAALPNTLSDLDAAQKLATRVNNEFGSVFGSAIRRCLNGDFDCESTSLEDEDFCQEFYAGVVVLLEENMKYAGLALVGAGVS